MMDEETNSETTRPAGREDVVRAHAAKKERLALYLVKHDRTPEVSIVSPLLFDVRYFLLILSRVISISVLFLLQVDVSGTRILSVGGLRSFQFAGR